MRPRDGAFGRRSPIRTLLSRDPLPVWRSVSAILPMSRQAVASTLGEPSPQLRKGRLSMTVSADSFDKLSEKIDSAKSAIRAAASQSEAELKAKVDEARKTADDRASELSVQTRTTGESVDTHWGQIQADWEKHRQSVRRRLDEAKTGEDLEAAELRAEWAEDDAA